MNQKTVFIAFVISLGGFLFGFDAGIISGVVSYVVPEYNLNDVQTGWLVSSPSFTAMIAMLISGRLSDRLGRKRILIIVAFLYALSAILSALAISYTMLYVARMIGGVAFGAALILAPMYIAEISTAEHRGKLVSIQQLNIVLGFFAAFLSNYFFNSYNQSDATFLTDENTWRWMLGVEFFPAIAYFLLLFFVPNSPRWLYLNNFKEKAKSVLEKIHGSTRAALEMATIEKSTIEEQESKQVSLMSLFQPTIRFVLVLGLFLGIIQQITGINAIYFYATSIFKQTGIGDNAAFLSGVILSCTTVVFTLIAMVLIDKMGRRPLLIVGLAGIAISLSLCAYEFNQATYQLDGNKMVGLNAELVEKLQPIVDKSFDSDVTFKSIVKERIGNQAFFKNEGTIIEASIQINSLLVLIGIIGFIACFAFSLGPVMWVMLSELYPNKFRGLAIGTIGFFNSFSSWFIQQIFPWELTNLGASLTFLIYAGIAALGIFVFLAYLPETKGQSLEEIEESLISK